MVDSSSDHTVRDMSRMGHTDMGPKVEDSNSGDRKAGDSKAGDSKGEDRKARDSTGCKSVCIPEILINSLRRKYPKKSKNPYD